MRPRVFAPAAKRNIALAEFNAPFGDGITDDLRAEIHVTEEGQWNKRPGPASTKGKPFFNSSRARATPPQPC
ncbi:hypothetical protein K3725_12905 [Leisingera sp. S132]|uniref:hypothetical protein n=1 Tax=Leisingera sp. S132 TaxID=2867016 RepID=UPI0021A7A993|nr:hypothetical protein [Leisingera sp. S132]UWQ78216.1 hypothetical protein K3725_12905 [Leisingera sp. S132]